MSKTVPAARPAVNIKRAVYAMATTDGQSAEITMYGDIYEQHPTDWDGNPVEGEFVLLPEFMEDLEQIASCKDITIRMNSYGGGGRGALINLVDGDAGVSITIHNRLRELARGGAKLTCVVDGVAMSGGSLIMCACDTVKVNPSSLVMIHKCWTFLFGGYNADEMRALADRNTAWDKAQATIYKRKTGLSDTVLTHMMADTTYMTGGEAVEKGFADELLEDAAPLDIAASADGRSLFVRGRTIHLTPGMFAPDSIPTVDPEASAPAKTHTNPPAKTGRKGGSTPMASTVEELRAEYPELTAQLEAEARAAADLLKVTAGLTPPRPSARESRRLTPWHLSMTPRASGRPSMASIPARPRSWPTVWLRKPLRPARATWRPWRLTPARPARSRSEPPTMRARPPVSSPRSSAWRRAAPMRRP